MRWHFASTIAASFLALTSLAQQPPAPAPAAATLPATAPAASMQTRVTLNLEGVSGEEALKELGKIGGIDFHSDNPGGWNNTDIVVLDAKDRPFWPTVLDVCRQAKINFYPYGFGGNPRQRQVRVQPGQEFQFGESPTCEVGGSLMMLQSEQRSYSLVFQRQQPAQTNLTINAIVLLDPRLQLATGNVTPRITIAVDENGVSLKRDDAHSYFGGGGQELFAQTMINLNYPPNAGHKIARLSGVLRMSAATKEDTWEITDILNAKPQTHETSMGTITIKSVKARAQGEGGYEVKLGIRQKSGASRGRSRIDQAMWGLVQKMELTTADGAKFSFAGGGGGDDWTVLFNSPSPKATPANFKWTVPLEVKEMEEPFEFKDLPIP